MVARVRRKNPYRMIMKKNLGHRIFPNKLQRQFHQLLPLKVFCTDITYIPLCFGFAYLSVIKDIASGEVMAWKLSKSLEMAFVIKTIGEMHLDTPEGILIHSDQGFHYTNPKYIDALKELKMEQSMSRKGNCIDNAPIESFFGHMKDELEYESCASFQDLLSKTNDYMRYYNYERKQWTRNKMTPIEYKNYLLTQP